MTSRQEARARGEETRKANAAARKATQEIHELQESIDRGLIALAMRDILRDQRATSKERIFAALTLDRITESDLIPGIASQFYREYADEIESAIKKAAETSAESRDSTA